MTHPHLSKLEKSIAKAAADTLSPEERVRMRSMLAEYAAMKPVRLLHSSASGGRANSSLFFIARYAFALLLVLAVGSGSVAYAAEGTLPGDLLYPVKVDVTEPIRTALQTTPAEEASWQMTLAARRIDEAATLAARGALSTSTEASLAARFEASASAADTAVATIATSSPDEAGIARATFAVRLSAYRDVLEKLDAERHASSTAPLQAALGARIAVNTAAGGAARPVLFAAAIATSSAASSTPPSKADLSRISFAVNASLEASADLLGALTQKLSSSTSAAARDEYARIAALASRGKDLEAKGDDSGALLAYQDSLSSAARLEVFTRAAASYHVDAFSSSALPQGGSSKEHAAMPVRALVPATLAPSVHPASAASTSASSTVSATTSASIAPPSSAPAPVLTVPAPSSSQTHEDEGGSVLGVPGTVPVSVPPPSVPALF
jgi:hypothetical protein